MSPLAVIAVMNWRWKRRKRISIGSVTSTEAAMRMWFMHISSTGMVVASATKPFPVMVVGAAEQLIAAQGYSQAGLFWQAGWIDSVPGYGE